MSVSFLAVVSLCLAMLAMLLAMLELRAKRLAEKAREVANRSATALAEQSQQIKAALNNMSQGLCMFNAKAEIVICNDIYLQMYELSPDVVKPGCTLRRLIEHRKETGLFGGDVDHYVASILANVASGETRSHIGSTADGRVINIVDRPMADGGWVVTHEDISERRRAEEKIAYMARHDALTDLANRSQFSERVEYELARARRSMEGFAVFVIDVDHFKTVNDSLGHPVGDRLLRGVAERLREPRHVEEAGRSEPADHVEHGARGDPALGEQAEGPRGLRGRRGEPPVEDVHLHHEQHGEAALPVEPKLPRAGGALGLFLPDLHLLVAVGDATAGEIVRRQLELHPITRDDADVELLHLA